MRATLIGSKRFLFHYTLISTGIFLILKNTNIRPSFALRFLTNRPFLTGKHPLGFKETGRWF